jgi:Peptidase C13 family
MLGRTGVQHRVVVISACYSGVSVGPLANANTLVITAADSDHSSFGCQDKVKWTYFGDAFFNRALRHTADLRSAFVTARKLISVRERHDGLFLRTRRLLEAGILISCSRRDGALPRRVSSGSTRGGPNMGRNVQSGRAGAASAVGAPR